ncbi:hypothetical protein N7522_003092 [Penicillium canescens]|nr:hypothetical protein N7522_003092 [Penicillium canescens]
MTQKVDLGRSLLRIRGSQLQLSLTTSAHLNQSPSHGSTAVSLGSSLEDIWIKESPELDLHFFIGSNWGSEHAVASFVSWLEPQLCGLEIWSDLGFSARLKTQEREDGDARKSDNCAPLSLKLGLRREPRKASHRKRWTLPAVMVDAPDACPPPGIPALVLTSLDICLEYGFHVESMAHSQSSNFDIDLFEQDPSVIAAIEGFDETMDHVIAASDPDDVMSQTTQADKFAQFSPPSQRDLLRLFDLALQRLVISNTIVDSAVHISNHFTLESLSSMIPVAFNAQYREAMNQRVVSIPIITKAISSMIEGGDNHSIQPNVADLLRYSHSSHADAVTINPRPVGLRSAIDSSLWRVAQENLHRLTLPPRRTWVFPTDLLLERATGPENTTGHWITPSQQPDIEFLIPDNPFNTQQTHGGDTCDAWILNETDLESDFDALSIGENIEISPDTGDSTQTSLDSSYSTITSSQPLHRYDDMMFGSEHGDASNHSHALMGENDYWEVAEYIGSPDSDIMLDDVF